jgi:hypothetical protein
MKSLFRVGLAVAAAASLFAGGYAVAQNSFGTPKSVMHVVTIKWKEDSSTADRRKALEGVREMARQIPGIKNIWLKATRVQPRDYHAVFAIEFADQAAAENYAEHPAREAWTKIYLPVREASLSVQITNE